MRGTITHAIFTALAAASVEGIELCTAILAAGYGAPMSRIDKIQNELREKRLRGKSTLSKEEQRTVRNYKQLISKLKQQGFLMQTEQEGKELFSLSTKGRVKLAALRDRAQRRLPPLTYEKSRTLRPIIVSFDVPEKEKRKREWLREALTHLGLTMIHKSVWVGTTRIPEAFLQDLEELRMFNYVEIFEVGKSGTLRHLT